MAEWMEYVENSTSSESICDTSHSSREEATLRKRRKTDGTDIDLTGEEGGMREFLVNERLTLSPLELSNPIAGIAIHAKRKLLKYNEALGGVVLAFDQLKVNGDPRVLDSGYVLVHVSVKYYAFSPQHGDKLKGRVSKVWEGRIACLVYECFNASVELGEGATVPHMGDSVDFIVRGVSRTKDGILAVEGLIEASKRKRKSKHKHKHKLKNEDS